MQDTTMFSNRLRDMIGDEAVTAFSKRAGLSEGTLRNLLKGGDPRLSNAIAVAKAGGKTLGWLIGEESSNHITGVAEDHPQYNMTDFSQVNLYDVNASAGHGSAVISDSFKRLYFRKEWFNSRGLKANDLVAINVVGDSMEPVIADGSVVLIDTTKTNIKDGAVYVFTYNGDLLIKRMMATVEGYKAKSINPLYDDMVFDKQTAQTLNVVGRAVRALPDIKL